MIPSRWVFLDRLPYTSSGKLERSSLPQLEPSGLENPGGELPRTRTEAKVLQIWRELFELEDIGIHQNFFNLGGHSLLAVSLFARMERDLGIRLPLSTLFEAPTVAQLASKLELPHELTSRSLLPIQVEGSHPPLFGLHAGPGRALMYGPLSRHLGSDFPLSGPYHLLGFCLGTMIAWEMAHQLEAQGESVRFLGAVSPSPAACRHTLTQAWPGHRGVTDQVQADRNPSLPR